MYNWNSKESITIYKTSARDITVIKGNSDVLYPFYRSSGINSSFVNTWFPWMGYFDRHPEARAELYMVKPPIPPQLSEDIQRIINQFFEDNAPIFMGRIGNDEALAISCSLGEGIWEVLPEFREEIMQSLSIKKYLKNLEKPQINQVEIPLTKTRLTRFIGIKCSGIVKESHAVFAKKMEEITREECRKFISGFSIQEKQSFSPQEWLESSTPKHNDTTYLINYGFLSRRSNLVKNNEEVQQNKLPGPT